MEEEKERTVGSISRELMMKEPDTRDPIELQREMQKDWENNIYECVARGKKLFDGDFYVVVDAKSERLMPNVVRNYFYPRKSCPYPHFDQTLYQYRAQDDDVFFLWVIPCKAACNELYMFAHDVPPDQHELLTFVSQFYTGQLKEKARQLNGE